MTRPKKNKPSATKGQKKLIHWGKNLLSLDDDAYRGLLWGVTGKASTLEITPKEAAKVLAEIERRMKENGVSIPWKARRRSRPKWRPTWLRIYPATVNVGLTDVPSASERQRAIIRDRWLILGRKGFYQPGQEQAALDGFLMKRFSVPSVNHLTRPVAKGVVKTLIEMTER